MYKLLFDSDALIKISKAEFLDYVVKCFKVIITEEIYHEAVHEGKKGYYQDAFKLEKFIKNKKINIIRKSHYQTRKKPKQNFGRGEISVFQAYKKDLVIVTDDSAFTSYIKTENMKSLSSAHILAALAKKQKIQKDKAYHCLQKLKPFIKMEIYELIR